MKKWFLLIVLAIGVKMVDAQGLGQCNFGDYPFGDCIITTSITTTNGGGGSLGTNLCPSGTINLFGTCLNVTFMEFTNFFAEMFRFGSALEYRILAPKQAYAGDTITITNQFENEGKNPTEINCVNFIDANKDAIIQNEEPIVQFNKLAEPQVKNLYNITLDIPNNLTEGNYLIGGKCNLLGVNSPNATAGIKINIKQRSTIMYIPTIASPTINSIFKDNWFLFVVILGSIIFAILLYQAGILHTILTFIITLLQLVIANPILLVVMVIIAIYLWWKYL